MSLDEFVKQVSGNKLGLPTSSGALATNQKGARGSSGKRPMQVLSDDNQELEDFNPQV